MRSVHYLRPEVLSNPGYKGGMLPIGPWRHWVNTGPYTHLTALEFAALADVDEAVVRRWRDGKERSVSLDVIDRALCMLGQPGVLNDLYPCCPCCGLYVAKCTGQLALVAA